MDFIAEFILEVILEGFFSVTVHNPKVKTWIKTLIFSLFVHILTALMVWGTVSLYQQGDGAWYVIATLAAAWGIGMQIAAIYGHKKGWPNNG